MRRLILTCAVVVAMAAPRAGAEADPELLDLDRVVELALERNPTLKAVEAQQDEADAAIREAWADVYPQLDLDAGWNQNRNPALLNSPDFDEIIEQFPDFSPSVQELYNWSIGLSQPLYQAGKIGAGIKLAKLVSQITEALIHTAQRDAGRCASEAYFRVLEAREGLATIEMAMADLDYPISLGAGVAAAQEFFRAGSSASIQTAA